MRIKPKEIKIAPCRQLLSIITVRLPTLGFFDSTVYPSFQKCCQLVFADAFLLAGVAVAESDSAVFLNCIKVYGDAKGRADFVLAAVAASDCAGGVVEDVPAALQFLVKCLCPLDQLGVCF